MGQLEVQRASFKTELEKQKSEKLAHARDPKLPHFEESKDKIWLVVLRLNVPVNNFTVMSGRM